jgi:hypothetical protein
MSKDFSCRSLFGGFFAALVAAFWAPGVWIM